MNAPPTGFGATVRRLRVAAGLTQADLAERAGISERTVSDLERGLRGAVYPATARQLAAALGVSSAELPAFLVEARGQTERATELGAEIGAVPGAHRARVPAPLTRMLGRESELAICLAMIRDPEMRLLTLVGPGGIGKTRLATEVASLVQSDFPGGVYFLDLSAIEDPSWCWQWSPVRPGSWGSAAACQDPSRGGWVNARPCWCWTPSSTC